MEVIRHYEGLYRRGRCRAEFSYRVTASGAWAASIPAHLFYFFRKLRLAEDGLFIDLGSGDGVVACIAGLFTRAIGIEADPALVCQAGRSVRDLKLEDSVRFICADFFTQRIQTADYLYIYPDKPIYALEESLQGWRGILLVYGPHFPPRRFLLAERLRCGKESLSVYRNPL